MRLASSISERMVEIWEEIRLESAGGNVEVDGANSVEAGPEELDVMEDSGDGWEDGSIEEGTG